MREGAISLTVWLLMIAGAMVAGVLGGVLYARHQPPPPRIVVVDMRRLVAPVMADSSLDAAGRLKRTTEIGNAVVAMIDQYAASGAIVLDASGVLRAPKDAYVAP